METKLDATNSILCVWPATLVGEENKADFEAWLKDTFGVAGTYLEEYKTLPDMKRGKVIPDTGGRNDALFLVRMEDISRFAVPRLGYGIRWWSDAVAPCNGGGAIVPREILKKYKDYA